jgi:opacity protein-like surface antigen
MRSELPALSGIVVGGYSILTLHRHNPEKDINMRLSSVIRSAFVALVAVVGASVISSAAFADVGSVRLRILKGGWVIGASGGSGVLTFQGRNYPLSVGGLSVGFTFGAAETRLVGRVRNINRPSDVAGVYGAGGAGAAVGLGAGVIVLTNEKGAILELSGRQAGLMVNADLSGLVLSVR